MFCGTAWFFWDSLDLQPASSPMLARRKEVNAMEPITLSLCPECDACPQVVMDADGVRIGEANNIVRLSRAEWNQLVMLVQGGRLPPIGS